METFYMTANLRVDHFVDITNEFIETEYVDVLFKNVEQLSRIMDEIVQKNIGKYHHDVRVYIEEIH